MNLVMSWSIGLDFGFSVVRLGLGLLSLMVGCLSPSSWVLSVMVFRRLGFSSPLFFLLTGLRFAIRLVKSTLFPGLGSSLAGSKGRTGFNIGFSLPLSNSLSTSSSITACGW